MNSHIIKTICLLTVIFCSTQSHSQIWFAKNAKVRFFSTTPIEDIEARNNYAAGAFNATTGKVYFKVMMKSFKFKKALMQEHFNENYIESDKYPSAIFEGFIEDLPDFSKSGTYNVKAKGNLTIHGVTVKKSLEVQMISDANSIKCRSKFKVPCRDHGIKIPKVTRKNISSNIDVYLYAVFKEKK